MGDITALEADLRAVCRRYGVPDDAAYYDRDGIENIAELRIHLNSAGEIAPEPMPAASRPRPLAEIEGEIHRQLDRALVDREHAGGPQGDADIDAVTAGEVESMANALDAIGRVRDRARLTTPVPPPFDVDTLLSNLWDGLEKAGASTAIADEAIAIVRAMVSP